MPATFGAIRQCHREKNNVHIDARIAVFKVRRAEMIFAGPRFVLRSTASAAIIRRLNPGWSLAISDGKENLSLAVHQATLRIIGEFHSKGLVYVLLDKQFKETAPRTVERGFLRARLEQINAWPDTSRAWRLTPLSDAPAQRHYYPRHQTVFGNRQVTPRHNPAYHPAQTPAQHQQ